MPAPIKVEFNGQLMSLRKLAKAVGIHNRTIQLRHFRGDRGEWLIRPPDKRFVVNRSKQSETHSSNEADQGSAEEGRGSAG
jgi:hypothetical protein